MTFDSVKEVIEAKINPVLALHNGTCELLRIQDNVVYVALLGGCAGCPSAHLTMFHGVKAILEYEFPEIKDIILE